MELKQKIEKIIEKSGAKIGLALHHIESGQEVFIDADSYYPLASVLKIPVLVEGCFRLSEGLITPDDRWTLKNSIKNLPSGVLVFFDEGLTPTFRDVLMMMIIISDNTATDMAINRLGKKAINDRMRSLGFNHIHIPMTIRELFQQMMPDPDPNVGLDELLRREREEVSEPNSDSVLYHLGPDNIVGTPREMTALLKLIWDGKAPDRQWSDFALNILAHQQFNERIPRYLPAGTKVAHKTGTIGKVRNDAAIIYVNDHSHVILTEFVLFEPESDPRKSYQRVFDIESAMGEIGLLAYEAFK